MREDNRVLQKESPSFRAVSCQTSSDNFREHACAISASFSKLRCCAVSKLLHPIKKMEVETPASNAADKDVFDSLNIKPLSIHSIMDKQDVKAINAKNTDTQSRRIG